MCRKYYDLELHEKQQAAKAAKKGAAAADDEVRPALLWVSPVSAAVLGFVCDLRSSCSARCMFQFSLHCACATPSHRSRSSHHFFRQGLERLAFNDEEERKREIAAERARRQQERLKQVCSTSLRTCFGLRSLPAVCKQQSLLRRQQERLKQVWPLC